MRTGPTETRHWLYQLIEADNPGQQPQFASQSTVNWARSLALEIQAEHGDSSNEQFESCKALFAAQPMKSTAPRSAAIFEPLFSSLTYSASVTSAALPERSQSVEWLLPGIIVSWYYAFYTAARSMSFAAGIAPPDTHGGVIKVFGGNLLDRVPHPLNMQARWVENEVFACELPSYPDEGTAEKLKGKFSATRPEAQANLRAYLRGEAGRQVDIVKDDLRTKGPKFQNFMTKDAKAARNARLQDLTVNFMHCAFRYRGKANYRDAIYLCYGSKPLAERDEFVAALATSAQFAFVCALAFIGRRVGDRDTRAFIEDVTRNLRGVGSAMPEEMFWKELSI